MDITSRVIIVTDVNFDRPFNVFGQSFYYYSNYSGKAFKLANEYDLKFFLKETTEEAE